MNLMWSAYRRGVDFTPEQVIALVRTVVRPAFVSRPRSEDFDKYHREFLGLGCRWDAARQMYVRKDGSVLPDAQPSPSAQPFGSGLATNPAAPASI